MPKAIDMRNMVTHLDAVPVLTGEGVLGSLLEALLALRQSLVPAVGNQPSEIHYKPGGGLTSCNSCENRFWGATYLPTAILTSSYVNGGTDVLLG